jgi:predicted transcriptional regulator
MVLTTTDVLKAISGQEALELLRIVARTNSYSDTGDTLKSKTKLSRKQYYSRMSGLMKTGLIKRRKGRHTLTAFGKVVYDTQIRIENAVNNYLNLKAIDSLEDSNDLPAEERKKLIDNLIDSQEIKAILASDINNNNKIESVEPLLGIEQQKARKQTHEENKKSKDEKHQREQ